MIKSDKPTKAYRDGWDRIFKKRFPPHWYKINSCPWCGKLNKTRMMNKKPELKEDRKSFVKCIDCRDYFIMITRPPQRFA